MNSIRVNPSVAGRRTNIKEPSLRPNFQVAAIFYRVESRVIDSRINVASLTRPTPAALKISFLIFTSLQGVTFEGMGIERVPIYR